MARYERDPRATAGAPPTPDGSPAKVTMALGADGRFRPVAPPRDLKTETEAKPKPSPADDPRAAFERSAPPFGPV
jgi:hypothetical protein